MDGLPTNLVNARVHWAVRAKKNRAATGALGAVIKRHLRPPRPLKKAFLFMLRESSSAPDFDGLVGSFKGVIDSLRYLGVIENDRFENIGFPRYGHRRAPAKRGKIQVVVIQAPEEHVFSADLQLPDADCR